MAKKKQAGSPLFELMAEMARDPKLLKAYRKDPKKVMTQYGLTRTQQKLLLSSTKDGKHADGMKAIADEAYRAFNIKPGPNPDTSII